MMSLFIKCSEKQADAGVKAAEEKCLEQEGAAHEE